MSNEILNNLNRAIIEYDREGAASWAKKAVEEKIDPIKTMDRITKQWKTKQLFNNPLSQLFRANIGAAFTAAFF